ncbi:hypothetical protein [Vibrio parahaemolyticus]|nr:hypothetical protein [Vibrio parahaemolyticus]
MLNGLETLDDSIAPHPPARPREANKGGESKAFTVSIAVLGNV